jgi:hypothetical protein
LRWLGRLGVGKFANAQSRKSGVRVGDKQAIFREVRAVQAVPHGSNKNHELSSNQCALLD